MKHTKSYLTMMAIASALEVPLRDYAKTTQKTVTERDLKAISDAEAKRNRKAAQRLKGKK